VVWNWKLDFGKAYTNLDYNNYLKYIIDVDNAILIGWITSLPTLGLGIYLMMKLRLKI
jgi:hypothetical protein